MNEDIKLKYENYYFNVYPTQNNPEEFNFYLENGRWDEGADITISKKELISIYQKIERVLKGDE